ncbi:hypothetical protein CDD82_5520 [Ophiocordyceps australis]|uniref:Uncharacterized protein n=1 Tax=Ophiocordyceps australis TaxID=1399860 RepID=A0A2C5ZKS2_9HYPO|nr:hypothetical protein CDD82_5520 [Ophiocordyceps australis]
MSVYHGGPGWYVTSKTPENARHIHGRPRSDRWADSSPSLDNAALRLAGTERARKSGPNASAGQSGDVMERTPSQEARTRAYVEAAERRIEARETQSCAPYLGQYDEEIERWMRQEEERSLRQKEQQKKREEKEKKRKEKRRDKISMQKRQKANTKAMPRRTSARRRTFSVQRFFALFRRLFCLFPEEPAPRGRSPSKRSVAPPASSNHGDAPVLAPRRLEVSEENPSLPLDAPASISDCQPRLATAHMVPPPLPNAQELRGELLCSGTPLSCSTRARHGSDSSSQDLLEPLHRRAHE